MAPWPSGLIAEAGEERTGDSFCRRTPAGGAPARGGDTLDASLGEEHEGEMHEEEISGREGEARLLPFLFAIRFA